MAITPEMRARADALFGKTAAATPTAASQEPSNPFAKPAATAAPEKKPTGTMAYLGQANKPKRNWFDSMSKAIGEFGTGVAKSFMKLPTEAAELGSELGLRGAAAMRGVSYEKLKSAAQGDAGVLGGLQKGAEKADWLKSKTGAEKAGEAVGDIGQFFIPVAGAEKTAATAAKFGKYGEQFAKALGMGEKGTKLISAAGKLGVKSVAEGMEAGARLAMQQGKVDQETVNMAMMGAAMPVIGEGLGLLKPQLGKWARELEKVNLRLTPAQKRTFADKIDDVSSYLVENGITGTAPKRLEKVVERYEAMEPKLQEFLTKTAADRSVSTQDMIAKLKNIKSAYQNRVDTDVIEGQIDRVIKNLTAKQGEAIPVVNLNSLKRSAYSSAYNEAGNKVLDDVMHDVGDVMRKSIEDATTGLQIEGRGINEFNKEYGTLIDARKLLQTAASRKDVGFLSKLVSSLVGHTVGGFAGPVGGAVGAAIAPGMAEVIAGTAPRSFVASGLESASKAGGAGLPKFMPKFAPTEAKAAEAGAEAILPKS